MVKVPFPLSVMPFIRKPEVSQALSNRGKRNANRESRNATFRLVQVKLLNIHFIDCGSYGYSR
jgi:hypothetical protein